MSSIDKNQLNEWIATKEVVIFNDYKQAVIINASADTLSPAAINAAKQDWIENMGAKTLPTQFNVICIKDDDDNIFYGAEFDTVSCWTHGTTFESNEDAQSIFNTCEYELDTSLINNDWYQYGYERG